MWRAPWQPPLTGRLFWQQMVVYYLVKWCSLPYEDSTWELKQDVDQSKIEEFERLRAAQPDPRRVVSPARLSHGPRPLVPPLGCSLTPFALTQERPLASQWKKRGESREYRNGNRLRDYQLEGVNWLLFNWYNRSVTAVTSV